MVNRLYAQLSPLSTSCPCVEAERRSQQWKAVAQGIEESINGGLYASEDDQLVETYYPGIRAFLDDEPDEISIGFFHKSPLRISPVTSLEGAAEHVAEEFRRIAHLCLEAAERLEGGER